MKKNISMLLILSVVLASSLASQAIAINNNDKGVVSVQTTESMEVKPDMAEIAFTVKTFDVKSMQLATNENKIIADKVFAELNNLINRENGDSIKTSDFSANPVYSYSNSKKIFEKYEVSNRVIVRTKSIDKIGTMIDKAIHAGATNVDSLSFSVSNTDSQCDDLIKKAVKKAKTRANSVAEALSTSIAGVSNITTSCSANNYNPPRLYMAKNMIADVAGTESVGSSATSISDGSIKINANVNANFFVK